MESPILSKRLTILTYHFADLRIVAEKWFPRCFCHCAAFSKSHYALARLRRIILATHWDFWCQTAKSKIIETNCDELQIGEMAKADEDVYVAPEDIFEIYLDTVQDVFVAPKPDRDVHYSKEMCS